MKGYKCFYNVNTKKFECENTPSEVGKYTPDGTIFWTDSYEHALANTGDYNKYNLNEVFICKNCNQPFFLDKKEQEWFEERKLNLPKRCYCCRKKGKNMSKDLFWEQVKGNVLTPGGDPLYICPVCKSKKSMHVNGIETPFHLDKCPACQIKLRYPYERIN